MKILRSLLLISIIFILFWKEVNAGTDEYTIDDVSKHSKSYDCWVIYKDKVYDISKYITLHDIYLNIRDWCGKDMTEDFKTKDGLGQDHKKSSYALLEDYYIGNYVNIPGDLIIDVEVDSPYNVILPILLGFTIYVSSYLLYKKRVYTLKTHNRIMNSLTLVSLIPSVLFGLLLSVRYTLNKWIKIDLEFFLYWHVEGSILFSVFVLCHFLQRIKIYLCQLKK